jgi:hypothetical protein
MQIGRSTKPHAERALENWPRNTAFRPGDKVRIEVKQGIMDEDMHRSTDLSCPPACVARAA